MNILLVAAGNCLQLKQLTINQSINHDNYPVSSTHCEVVFREVLHPDRIGIWKCCFFFGERGKPEYPEKNLSEQSREPTTNSTHIWRRDLESNPGHIGGRRVLSPLRQPCSSNSQQNPTRYSKLPNKLHLTIYITETLSILDYHIHNCNTRNSENLTLEKVTLNCTYQSYLYNC